MSSNIKAVERALEILLYLNRQAEPVGISQISKDLGIYKSTVFRTLQTLESQHFVEQHKDSGKYGLGVVYISMASKINTHDIYRPFAASLHKEFNEAVNVSILDASSAGVYRSIIVLKEDSKDNILSVSPRVGSVMDCYCSSVGKCLLAFSPNISERTLKNYKFVRYTVNTITDVPALLAEIRKVREQGYAVDDEEQEIGLTCVGVPILDRKGEAVAAMSVSGPTQRMQNHDIALIVQQLKRTSANISALL
jgi:DNA-binding IclR family transcriptional regulator